MVFYSSVITMMYGRKNIRLKFNFQEIDWNDVSKTERDWGRDKWRALVNAITNILFLNNHWLAEELLAVQELVRSMQSVGYKHEPQSYGITVVYAVRRWPKSPYAAYTCTFIFTKDIPIIIKIIFINCNWVVTRWQWLFYINNKFHDNYIY